MKVLHDEAMSVTYSNFQAVKRIANAVMRI